MCGRTALSDDQFELDPCTDCGGNISFSRNSDKFVAKWSLFNNEWQWVKAIDYGNMNEQEAKQVEREYKINRIFKGEEE